MSWNWQELSLWFFTAFVGAGIIKLLDLAVERYKYRNSKVEQKVEKIITHLNGFGELTELFRFHAFVSSTMVKDDEGNFLKDEKGNYLVESIILEPEPEYREAIKALKETDLSGAIAQKIATLRLQSAEVMDLCKEIDPSGNLNKEMRDLFVKAVLRPSDILKHKHLNSPDQNFRYMYEALNEADDTRSKLRARKKIVR